MASFNPMRAGQALFRLVAIFFDLVQDVLRLLLLGTRSSAALKAENIFLRKQLALYLEREVKPRRATDATRLSMVLFSRFFANMSTVLQFIRRFLEKADGGARLVAVWGAFNTLLHPQHAQSKIRLGLKFTAAVIRNTHAPSIPAHATPGAVYGQTAFLKTPASSHFRVDLIIFAD